MFPLFSFIGENKMSQLHSIAVNGIEYELPSINQFSSQIQDLAQTMSSIGVTVYEMTEAIKRMSEVLSRLEYHSSEITAIKDDLHDLRYECEGRDATLQASIDIDKIKIDELRSVLDAKTETPNQKSDLEIFSQIEQNPFLPGFVDLDSERPLWDFTVDF